MPPGSSAGLDGIRPLHLRQLISRDAAESGRRLLGSLTTLTNLALAGRVPDCARNALFSASLCALRKRSGGLRPIAVGSVYRRLPSRIAARHLASGLGAELRPIQLGVGTPWAARQLYMPHDASSKSAARRVAPEYWLKLTSPTLSTPCGAAASWPASESVAPKFTTWHTKPTARQVHSLSAARP